MDVLNLNGPDPPESPPPARDGDGEGRALRIVSSLIALVGSTLSLSFSETNSWPALNMWPVAIAVGAYWILRRLDWPLALGVALATFLLALPTGSYTVGTWAWLAAALAVSLALILGERVIAAIALYVALLPASALAFAVAVGLVGLALVRALRTAGRPFSK